MKWYIANAWYPWVFVIWRKEFDTLTLLQELDALRVGESSEFASRTEILWYKMLWIPATQVSCQSGILERPECEQKVP